MCVAVCHMAALVTFPSITKGTILLKGADEELRTGNDNDGLVIDGLVVSSTSGTLL